MGGSLVEIPLADETDGEDAAVIGLVAILIRTALHGMMAFNDGGCRLAMRH